MAGADLNSQALAFYKGQNNSATRPASLLNGCAYFAEVVSGSILTSNSFDVHVTTGDNPVFIEFIRTRKTDGDYTFSLYEGSTITASTDTTPVNMNRTSTNVSGFTTGEATTVSDVGTLLFNITHVETTKQSEAEAAEGNFMKLSPNTAYIMRYTNDDVAATVFVGNYVFVEIK
jgi:hypothetical protein